MVFVLLICCLHRNEVFSEKCDASEHLMTTDIFEEKVLAGYDENCQKLAEPAILIKVFLPTAAYWLIAKLIILFEFGDWINFIRKGAFIEPTDFNKL